MEASHLLPAVGVALLAVITCVLLHYEGLSLLDRVVAVERRFIRTARPRIVLVVLGVMVLHIGEIWLFAGVYALLEQLAGQPLGMLMVLNEGVPTDTWFHYVYFSSVVYTTVGFGEIVPVGLAFRLLATSEALLGLVLIAWSASFTYLHMQRLWGK